MKLLIPLNDSEKLDHTSESESHTVSVPSVCNIKSFSARFHFAGEEWEVHPPRRKE